MDPSRVHDNNHQKDFMAFLFPESSSDQQRGHDSQQNEAINAAAVHVQRPTSGMLNFTGLTNPPPFNQQLDLMTMSNLMSMQGMDTTSLPALPSSTGLSPQVVFEQQYKLTQLHQLQQLQNQIQNQIFQQQLALISAQSTLNAHDSSVEPAAQITTFSGLPTPMSSTELRPLPNPEFLGRISSQYPNPQDMYSSHALDPVSLPSPHDASVSSQYLRETRHPGSSSAPANIVFHHTSPPMPLPSPPDLDIDISPLTSPWLEAYHTQRPPNKRTISPSAEDAARAVRKRGPSTTSPAPTVKQSIRHAKSATNTPLLRSTKSRRNSTIMETDSPSPVDLSMPPPAPPGPRQSPPNSAAPSTHEGTSPITPVTPASIMNLGRLGISSSLTTAAAPTSQKAGRVKEPARAKIVPDSGAPTKGSKRGSLPFISPGPKPILPAGTPSSLNAGSSTLSPGVPNRKSHKDAEQKRRDSLKTAYDDLRVLLPPVPLPSDENFPDEPILPGALPPRGPPKVGGDGPNKGVSKLQLLRCGNDFIRTLKGRVERRDSEIENLRREVLRLRAIAGDAAGGEHVDLETDLDAIEAYTTFRQSSLGAVAEGDDADDAEE
ncbi:hypothetical protein DEU56DRAFT_818767 [Suillus clintonianus]|uniref:uncharacterized protein n=1 Tax=Suillus clintonianus TaxID=1904413 RepID=UPI001B8748EF|nr:uncharacterized protein DEU56DRAFT_818767 [Suillus clintonianus]KAG2128721.1 hypothetical protein DEU56DRAFT_818767 [Suillus clintonianus]